MKIKIWESIEDGGDGEHHSGQYPSKQAMIDDLGLIEVDDGENGLAWQEGQSVPVVFSTYIFDTEGYEVIE